MNVIQSTFEEAIDKKVLHNNICMIILEKERTKELENLHISNNINGEER